MLDKDGYLYVRGRQDDLVIVGGENVFTGEVVSEILTHEEVADAAVIGVPDEAYGATLCAYVVLRPSAAVTESDLRRHCRNRLPPSKVPKALRIVPELPRNAAMKLLRHELHTPQKESVRESADRERERAQSDEADAR
jgi:acyl-coenzyme A synthetase/AMP-(fatty) acid ligase